MRSILPIALAVAAGALVGCGGNSDTKGPLGSESNPLVAVPNPSHTRTPPTEPRNEAGGRSAKASSGRPPASSKSRQPGAAKGTSGAGSSRTGSSETPRSSSGRRQKTLAPGPQRPCSLVTKSEARSIFGAAIEEPLQAPQGPTCIYQTPSGKQFVTLAVQTAKFAALRRQLRKTRRVDVSGRTAYCGIYGRPMLYLPLAGRHVLSISAPCATATAFAARAATRL